MRKPLHMNWDTPSTIPTDNRKTHHKTHQPAPPSQLLCTQGQVASRSRERSRSSSQEPEPYHSHSSFYPNQLPTPPPTSSCPAGGREGWDQEGSQLLGYVDGPVGKRAVVGPRTLMFCYPSSSHKVFYRRVRKPHRRAQIQHHPEALAVSQLKI